VGGGVGWENRRLKEMEKKDRVHRNVVRGCFTINSTLSQARHSPVPWKYAHLLTA
jgi:hypothetical protein